MINLLFIAQYYPNELLPIFLKQTKVGLDFAAHNLNKALFSGFAENGQSLSILNTPHVGSFPPFYKSIFIPSYENADDNIKSISYLNISYIKRWDIKRRIKEKILDWCSTVEGKKIIVFYNFDLLPLLSIIKAQNPDVKGCLLVTDLKEYMAPDNSFYTRLNRLISSAFFEESEDSYKLLDGYILLAKGMKDKLPVGKTPWIQMEGIYNPEGQNLKAEKDSHKVILYTGNVGKRYGILNLLDAFEKIPSKDYRLWIRGNGETVDEIKRRASLDSRIVYFEQMSKEELQKLQLKATVLVNPVSDKEEFTQYFFPSKTLEYMASGTPVIMYPLSCMPNEYHDHLYYFKHYDAEGMAADLMQVCEQDKEILNHKGLRAKSFIEQYKTPYPQVKQILEFLETI